MEEEVKKTKNLVLRKIDIKREITPVVRQFKLRRIPYFILYSPAGKVIGKGSADFFHKKIRNWKKQKWIQKIWKAYQNREKKITLISKGKKVDVRKHLVKGRYTIIEFYADW